MLTYFKIDNTNYGINYVNNDINIMLNYKDSSLIFTINNKTIHIDEKNFYEFKKKYINNYIDVYSIKYLYTIILYSLEIHSYNIKTIDDKTIFHVIQYSDYEFMEPIEIKIIFE